MVFGFVFGGVSKIEREHGPSGYGHRSGIYTFQVVGLGSRFAENELHKGVVFKCGHGSLDEVVDFLCGFHAAKIGLVSGFRVGRGLVSGSRFHPPKPWRRRGWHLPLPIAYRFRIPHNPEKLIVLVFKKL